MDHAYVGDTDLIERYLTGRLGVEESAAFEEHFVDCAECIDRLSATRGLIEGLRMVSAQDANRFREQREGFRGLFTSFRWSVALTTAALLVATVALVWTAIQVRNTRREAENARNVANEWQHRYESSQDTSSKAEAGYLETERELKDRLARVETDLEALRAGRAQTEKPQINIPIVSLTSTRASDPSAVNQLSLPRDAANFVIAVSLAGGQTYSSYRMKIVNRIGTIIWESGGLKPDSYNLLRVLCDSGLVADGDYAVTVESVIGGARSIVGIYALRVTKHSQ